jgi:hypothetical protein
MLTSPTTGTPAVVANVLGGIPSSLAVARRRYRNFVFENAQWDVLEFNFDSDIEFSTIRMWPVRN